MLDSAEEPPKEFLQRCGDIMAGREVITSAKQLRAFWLFAIEQGEDEWRARPRIAELAIEAAGKARIPGIRIGLGSEDKQIDLAYDYMESNSIPMDHGNDTDKTISDQAWRTTREVISGINP